MGELEKAVTVDQHGIEAIPETDPLAAVLELVRRRRDPAELVVGDIGPQLGLSLVQSIEVMFFGPGGRSVDLRLRHAHEPPGRTLSHLALGRMAFGRRYINLPANPQDLTALLDRPGHLRRS